MSRTAVALASFDNSLVISLWGAPLRSGGSLEIDSSLALGKIQVVTEGTIRALVPWLGRPPGSSSHYEKEKLPFCWAY